MIVHYLLIINRIDKNNKNLRYKKQFYCFKCWVWNWLMTIYSNHREWFYLTIDKFFYELPKLTNLFRNLNHSNTDSRPIYEKPRFQTEFILLLFNDKMLLKITNNHYDEGIKYWRDKLSENTHNNIDKCKWITPQLHETSFIIKTVPIRTRYSTDCK